MYGTILKPANGGSTVWLRKQLILVDTGEGPDWSNEVLHSEQAAERVSTLSHRGSAWSVPLGIEIPAPAVLLERCPDPRIWALVADAEFVRMGRKS